jgi:hypothetical protein
VYRDYWRRHIGDKLSAYAKDRHYRELREAFVEFFAGAEPELLENAAAQGNPNGMPVDGSLSLSFLLGFYNLVFIREINVGLQPIVGDGEFLKRENHAEFAGSFNDLAKMGDDIRSFDAKLSPQGMYGERYAQARQDMSSLPVKRRKIQLVLEDASIEVVQIVERARAAFDRSINIISGILKKDPGGAYDSLSNLPQLEVKHPNLQADLQHIRQRLKETVHILDSIAALEAESR